MPRKCWKSTKRLYYRLLNIGLSIKMRTGFCRKITEDPKYRSKLCTEWKEQSGIVTLDWPSPSLDANPIENVGIYQEWTSRKTYIYTKTVISRDSLNLESLAARIRRQFNWKYASKMPSDYRRRWWLDALLRCIEVLIK